MYSEPRLFAMVRRPSNNNPSVAFKIDVNSKKSMEAVHEKRFQYSPVVRRYVVLLAVITASVSSYFCLRNLVMFRSDVNQPQREDPVAVVPVEPPRDPPTQNRSTTIMYSIARKDRSGAFIQDMLLADAYAFRHNFTYGGACVSPNVTVPSDYQKQHEELIRLLGLQTALPIVNRCPPDGTNTRVHGSIVEKTRIIVQWDREVYAKFNTRLWTRDWLAHLPQPARDISTTTGQPGPPTGKDRPSRGRHKSNVVVYIRRGDVSPCIDEWFRYLPNSHYIALIERYGRRGQEHDKHRQVTIYSESKSLVEGWDDFVKYQLVLDAPVATVWSAIITADVVILSKSSFSTVPAIFNRQGTIVYTPFWYAPLKNWTIVDRHLERDCQRKVHELRRTHCTSS